MPSSPSSTPFLIVEDDRKVSALVSLYLEREGFRTMTAYDGREALELAERHHPMFVVLDIMLPHVDGWDVCRALRRISDVPILILTARAEEMDRVVGLSLGADDYVVKPFSPRELVARVKTILRRARAAPAAGRLSTFDRLTLDFSKRKVTLDGRTVALTASEYLLLETLMGAPGRIFSRQELLDRLYQNGEAVIERVVDVHLGKVRQKIETDPSQPRYILTVRGMGYRFADADEA